MNEKEQFREPVYEKEMCTSGDIYFTHLTTIYWVSTMSQKLLQMPAMLWRQRQTDKVPSVMELVPSLEIYSHQITRTYSNFW